MNPYIDLLGYFWSLKWHFNLFIESFFEFVLDFGSFCPPYSVTHPYHWIIPNRARSQPSSFLSDPYTNSISALIGLLTT